MAIERRSDGGQTRWLALIASLLFACGGRASGSARAADAGAAGIGAGASANPGAMASGGATSAGAGADGLGDAPSTVTLLGSSGETEGPATRSMIGPCFLGFASVVDGIRLEFDAFVQAPGDYQGDSTHILLLTAHLADGRTFSVGDSDSPFGEIDLHVAAVSPRFVGTIKATIHDDDDPTAPPLALSLAFDVDVAAGETCGL